MTPIFYKRIAKPFCSTPKFTSVNCVDPFFANVRFSDIFQGVKASQRLFSLSHFLIP